MNDGPAFVHLIGDREVAQSHLAEAQHLRAAFRSQRRVNDRLSEGESVFEHRTFTLADRTLVHVITNNGQDTIRIIAQARTGASTSEGGSPTERQSRTIPAIPATQGTWMQLQDGPRRFGHSAVWDAQNLRMLTFGGAASMVPTLQTAPVGARWATVCDGQDGISNNGFIKYYDANVNWLSDASFAFSSSYFATHNPTSEPWRNGKPATNTDGGTPINGSPQFLWDLAETYFSDTTGLDELWSFTDAGWALVSVAPFKAISHFAAWDEINSRMVVWGGDFRADSANYYLGLPIWEFLGGVWTELFVMPDIASWSSGLMTIDLVGNQVIFYDSPSSVGFSYRLLSGGTATEAPVYDSSSHLADFPLGPSSRTSPTAFDALNRRLMLPMGRTTFADDGSIPAENVLAELWALDVRSTPAIPEQVVDE